MQPLVTDRLVPRQRHLSGEAATRLVPSAPGHHRSKTGTSVLEFRRDVLAGLSQSRKELHCKYFYDERGSQLFDQICELEEYYPMRVESQIMESHATAMSECIGPEGVVVEYGSGSSTKTRILLDSLQSPRAYLPVDISEDHLLKTARQLRMDYREIDIQPIVADFTHEFTLPSRYASEPITVYFPGSTLGNLEQPAAVRLLNQIGRQCGKQGGLLLGIDLDKSTELLHRAYNDRLGITAEFNLNLLHRINRELDGRFKVSQFRHRAIVNREQTRVEIYIESLQPQIVSIGDRTFEFAAGELIFTEYSHKYQLDQFEALAAQAGLKTNHAWTDADEYFAVLHLVLQ